MKLLNGLRAKENIPDRKTLKTLIVRFENWEKVFVDIFSIIFIHFLKRTKETNIFEIFKIVFKLWRRKRQDFNRNNE